MKERCRRICGTEDPRCFIGNLKQVECISDMVLNKVSGIMAVIELTLAEEDRQRISENLVRALSSIEELVNWVKFLQISHDLRAMSSLIHPEGQVKGGKSARKEMRFPLPEAYHKYIAMEIDISGTFVQVSLVNFSRRGIQFLSGEPVPVDSRKDCRLCARHGVRKEVTFRLHVRHAKRHQDAYIIGGLTEEISDNTAFDFFESIYELIRNALPGTE